MTTEPISSMNCTEFEDNLGAYLEGDLDAATRAAAERHRATCAHCAALAADLERIATEAAHLPTLRPSRDLWAGIAERIEAPVVALGARPAAVTPGTRHRRLAWPMAAAAAALIAVTAGVTHQVTARALRDSVMARGASGTGAERPAVPASPTPEVAAAPVAPAEAPSPTAERRSDARPGRGAAFAARRSVPVAAGEAVYDQQIAELRAVLRQRSAELDPETVDILERNIGVIDAAIEQSRQALARDPRSSFLGEQITRALDQKVQLLRTAVSLPSRT